ncbi:MAG TPA: DNA/RNA nuclease SfsA [Methanothermococcus okinawensis]|uniref:Sugar fermentation stimulation protein homolog n=1 Tax=Methanothermococcus okinawensis TaxID=155863 RepID=A0A833E4J0_9EURY|nr:DNA/RNA nuclease SfsA [Methanothermococcus okinawensis]HIP91715.1 DNA/RNA nuclease SfsA [Methanothermococcus okinawensis]
MKLMDLKELGNIEVGRFIKRENRFLGKILVDNRERSCHIADTGRLRDILVKNREIWVIKNREGLKTDYTLVGVNVKGEWVLVNSALHSNIAYRAIEKGVLGYIPKRIRREVTFKNSRFDFLVDNNTFVELKGCNLVKGNTGYFPDAPTKRGVKHLKELIEAKERGYNAVILIMALRRCNYFLPNWETDRAFSEMFYRALEKGVDFKGFRIKLGEDGKVYLKSPLKLAVLR